MRAKGPAGRMLPALEDAAAGGLDVTHGVIRRDGMIDMKAYVARAASGALGVEQDAKGAVRARHAGEDDALVAEHFFEAERVAIELRSSIQIAHRDDEEQRGDLRHDGAPWLSAQSAPNSRARPMMSSDVKKARREFTQWPSFSSYWPSYSSWMRS
jgi:hypothetical protein